jgi:DNA-directed RNA polymerase subunit H (RpoH/RPB5)
MKMLADRKWILRENIQSNVNEIMKNKNDDNVYTIKLDVKLANLETYDPSEDKTKWKNFNDNTIALLFVQQKINTKIQSIIDFISKYTNMHKIIIGEEVTERGRHLIMQQTNSRSIEVFMEHEFLMNLLEHVCSPKYEILSQIDADKMREDYNATKRQMPKMYDNDTAARYFYLKKNQTVRIIRNTENTAESIAYRYISHKGNTAM